MRNTLVRSDVLWLLFIVVMALNIGFFLWIPHVGGVILDESLGAGAQAIFDGMSPAERRSHGWMTLSLDILYPFAYGLLFAGLALKAFPKRGAVLSVIALMIIPFDLAENTVQIMALLGGADVLWWKNVFTPAKLVLFGISAGAALVSVGVLCVRRVRNSNAG